MGLISKIYKELKQLNSKKRTQLKNGQGPEQTFMKKHTDGHQACEKVLNITSHQGTANQDHSEILPCTC